MTKATKKSAKKTVAKKAAKKKAPVRKPRVPSSVLQMKVENIALRPELEESQRYWSIEPTRIPEAAWTLLLQDIAQTGHITDSCKRVGIKRVTFYARRRDNAEFDKLAEEAHRQGLKSLEDFAVQRATVGVQKPVFFQGDIVGYTTEYSDQLLSFLLQGNDPKYKRKQEITGADGGPISLLVQLSDEELDEEIAKLQRDSGEVKRDE